MKFKRFGFALVFATAAAGSMPAWCDDYQFSFLTKYSGFGESANAVNASGQIAGSALALYLNTGQAVVWTSGSPNPLATGDWTITSSAAAAINASGQTAGSGMVDGKYVALKWDGATYTVLNSLGSGPSFALGLNDAGVAVGQSQLQYGATHATLWNGTQATDLGTLGGTTSVANSINNQGMVVGQSWTAYNVRHAALWTGDHAVDLGMPGGAAYCSGGTYCESSANDINDSGQIAGYLTLANGGYHAVVWHDGTVTDIGQAGRTGNSTASAINSHGQVVGYAQFEGSLHAALWSNGNVIDLNSFLDPIAAQQGWVLMTASDINDNGLVVGTAFNQNNGKAAAYLLSPVLAPVPEPSSYTLLAAGLVAVGAASRRRAERRKRQDH